MSDSDERFVTLQGGLIVPAAPYVLLLTLEARGFAVHRDGDTLVVQEPEQNAEQRDAGLPPERLTGDDDAAIRQWKHHLLLLLDYCNRLDLDAHLFTDTAKPSTSVA